MGIERFVSRRGVSSVIWSDNGTNFIASEKELLNNILSWNQQVLTETLVKKGIKWKFNPPSAPHYGGVWERLVRSFKHVFHAILGNRRLTDEILNTVFCQVEQSLNAHPLIPASADATDLDALTPNHFLLGNVGSSLPSHLTSDFDHRACIRQRHLESMAEGIRPDFVSSIQMVISFRLPFEDWRLGLDRRTYESTRTLPSCTRCQTKLRH